MGRETKGVDADLEIGEGQPLFIRWNIHGQVGHARFPLAALQACNLEPWKWNPFSIGAPVERHAHSTHAAHWTRARHAHASTSREIRDGPSQPGCVNCLERVHPTPVQTPLDVARGTRVIIHIARSLKKLKASRFPRVASEKRGTTSVQRLQRLQGGLPGFAA
jgi:hypothetical protein